MIDDREFDTPKYSPVCTYCKHVRGFRVCTAFEEIPLEIWNGENKHHEPYLGDRGIRFEKAATQPSLRTSLPQPRRCQDRADGCIGKRTR